MDGWRMVRELKRDGLGRVELLEGPGGRAVRRVACGGRIPLSGVAARYLMRRERRALERLAGLEAVPQLAETGVDAAAGARADTLLRAFVEGEPLHRARELPVDFFDRLDDLVQSIHARGVCHNDLHKEQNIVVQTSGWPALIDFQLASCHAVDASEARSRKFAARVHDDLRHVQKHRRRYTRDGRGPSGEEQRGVGHGKRRTPLARVWRRVGKPVYVFVTRRLLRTRDGEERRPSSGPWPEWVEAVGPPQHHG